MLITNPRDLPAFVKELRKWKWSVLTGVNTLFNGLLNTPGFDRTRFFGAEGRGRRRRGGAESRWRRMAAGHGRYLTEAYGLTESSPAASINPLGTPWNGSIGLPFPRPSFRSATTISTSCRSWTGAGDIEKYTGEICIRGPQVMKGYWTVPRKPRRCCTTAGSRPAMSAT